MPSACNNGPQPSYVRGNGSFASSTQIEFLRGKPPFLDRWEMRESDWTASAFEIADKLGVDSESHDGRELIH